VDDPIDQSETNMVQYPKIRIAVNTFVLQQKSESHLRIFHCYGKEDSGLMTRSAQTFCANCGLHIMHALRPDATELYINAQCCRTSDISPSNYNDNDGPSIRPTLSVAPSERHDVAVERSKLIHTKRRRTRSNDKDDDILAAFVDDECREDTFEDHDDPLFTVTEASSISQSFSSCLAEDASVLFSDLDPPLERSEQIAAVAYRLRKMVSPDARSQNSMRWQSDLYNNELKEADYRFGYSGRPISKCASLLTEDDYDDDSKITTPRDGSTIPTAASTSSYADENASFASTRTTPSVVNETTHWQLRRFMSKHVESST
jgi:hypothetical protein